MLIEINEINVKEFLIWANSRSFCNSGQHVCDRIATTFEGIPAEDRYDREPNKVKPDTCRYPEFRVNVGCVGCPYDCSLKIKPLAQYLAEYLVTGIDRTHEAGMPVDFTEDGLKLILEQALDAYESTENVKIKIERSVI